MKAIPVETETTDLTRRQKYDFWLHACVVLIALVCLAFMAPAARADVLTLPSSLREISEEAFMGDTSIGEVFVPEGTVSIGDYAFANSSLATIHLPKSLSSIGEHAFDGCRNLTLFAPTGAPALSFARGKGIRCITVIAPGETAKAVITNRQPTALFSYVPERDCACTFGVNTKYAAYGYIYDSDMNVLASNENGGSKLQFKLKQRLTAGTQYYFGTTYTVSGTGSYDVSLKIAYLDWNVADDVLYLTGLGDMDECIDDAPWPNTIHRAVIGEGITTIGNEAFSGCTSLTEVVIPDSVTTIRDRAFYECRALTAIALPDRLYSIGQYAFYNCAELTALSIPSHVTNIAYYNAFYECNSLSAITVSPDNNSYASFDGVLYTKDMTELLYCPCAITELTLPSTVTSIPNPPFDRCRSLTAIHVAEGNPEYGEISGMLYTADRSALIFCPPGIVSVDLPDGITEVFEGQFKDCASLTSVTLPDTVTSIGASAFYGCAALTDLAIPEGVTSIGDYTFYNCSALTDVTIPASVTSIGAYAFRGCSHLANMEIPESVTNIGEYAFCNCFGLTSMAIPEGVTSINNYTFGNCRALTDVTIPAGVTTIGASAFRGCSRLASLTLPASVTSIGACAFSSYPLIVTFLGDAPTMDEEAFSARYASGIQTVILAVYPHGNSTWNADSMRDYGADQIIWKADDAFLTPPDTPKDESEALISETSSTNGRQNYSTYGQVVRDYLFSLPDGGRTRVEYTGSAVVIEEYTAAGTLAWKKTLPAELPLWGGFYAGTDYHFFVFGQNNLDEDDSVEVVRVVRYSKNWHRLDSTSVYGANTTEPFASGSCRIMQSGDMLYIHTCHRMYMSSDGKRHQANMNYDIHIPSMSIMIQNYTVGNSSYDYVSHSFNQFLIGDGNDIIKVDHGDAYPRSITLMRIPDSASGISRRTGTRITLMPLSGEIGANATGASVGGLEASSTHYLVAANSVDQSNASNSTQRNIYILAANKAALSDNSVTTIHITEYPEAYGKYVSTPVLVKINDERFLILWTEGTSAYTPSSEVHYRFLNAAGLKTSQEYVSTGRLSDCQPVVQGNKVMWYVTADSAPVFYTIDLDDPGTIHCD